MKILKELTTTTEKQLLAFLKTGKLPEKGPKLAEVNNRAVWIKAGLPEKLASRIAEFSALQ